MPRWVFGAGNRSRTYDLRITNALLYQLSYTGMGFCTRVQAAILPDIVTDWTLPDLLWHVHR